jgi:hypothetical protein
MGVAMSGNVAEISAAIDSFDPDQFVARPTEDVSFQFGNAEPVVGRAAIRCTTSSRSSRATGLDSAT